MLLIPVLSCRSKGLDFNYHQFYDATSYMEDEKSNPLQLSDSTLGFQSFWKEFRSAVLSSDSVKLTKMTKFPLSTHGNQDTDPQPDIDEKAFYKVFNLYLNRNTVFYNGSYERNIDEIQRIPEVKIKLDSGIDTWQRVGDMEFEKGIKGWQLTRIYIDTNEL